MTPPHREAPTLSVPVTETDVVRVLNGTGLPAGTIVAVMAVVAAYGHAVRADERSTTSTGETAPAPHEQERNVAALLEWLELELERPPIYDGNGKKYAYVEYAGLRDTRRIVTALRSSQAAQRREIEKLKAEAAQHLGAIGPSFQAGYRAAQSDIAAQRREDFEALKRYGKHEIHCALILGVLAMEYRPCSCGFDKLLDDTAAALTPESPRSQVDGN